MGHRDDFYQEKNITGYTGDIKHPEKVTVYFQGGGEFGRITQFYEDDPTNVGRNKVRTAHDYKIYNDKGSAIEFYDGGIQHKSRNLFMPVGDDATLKYELAKSIARFPDLKSKYKKS